jgi:REP element-mobilizing transposase RayT
MVFNTKPVYPFLMPKIARIVVPESPHHVTQRGNNRAIVFSDDEDGSNTSIES